MCIFLDTAKLLAIIYVSDSQRMCKPLLIVVHVVIAIIYIIYCTYIFVCPPVISHIANGIRLDLANIYIYIYVQ